MSNQNSPTPIRKKHILPAESRTGVSDALVLAKANDERPSWRPSQSIIRFQHPQKRKFSLKDLSISGIAMKLVRSREQKEHEKMVKMFLNYFSQSDPNSKKLLEDQAKASAARQRMDFSKQRNSKMLEAIDQIAAADRVKKCLSREEALSALHPTEKDPLAIAILHWCHEDVPSICKQIKQIVGEIEAASKEGPTAQSPTRARTIRFVSLTNGPQLDPKKLEEVYQLLDRADAKELLPYGTLNQNLSSPEDDIKLPDLKPMDPKTELIYRWLCTDHNIRYQAMYAISWHSAFKSLGIDRELFDAIEEMETQDRERTEEMATQAGFEPYCHIDAYKLREALHGRMNFSEAIVTLWKEIKARF